jgi:uncharacterized membrane protein
MAQQAAITILHAREEVERRWQEAQHPPELTGESVTYRFVVAPGDRGTEIHVELRPRKPGVLGIARDSTRLAKVKDSLRRFKQQVETGEIARSEAVPEGETVKRKLKQRSAQPLTDDERQKVGV